MRQWARWVFAHFGVLGAGLIFLLEGFGAPIPVEIPLYIIGSRVARGHNTYWEMVLLMWSFTLVGNTIGYFLGYYGGRPLVWRLAGWFRVRPETLDRVEAFFRRYGLWMTLATRWLNWGFAQNMWLCGITRVPLRLFLPVMAINDFLWAMAWTWVASHFVGRLHVFWAKLDHRFPAKWRWGLALAAAAALAGWLAWRWWRTRRRPA